MTQLVRTGGAERRTIMDALASAAAAQASRVLPDPGGPYMSTPRGGSRPYALKKSGRLSGMVTRRCSSFARRSTPARSAYVVCDALPRLIARVTAVMALSGTSLIVDSSAASARASTGSVSAANTGGSPDGMSGTAMPGARSSSLVTSASIWNAEVAAAGSVSADAVSSAVTSGGTSSCRRRSVRNATKDRRMHRCC